MTVIFEGLVLCFIVLLVCVLFTADGPVGAAFFYEKDVQERVVKLGLITEERLRKRKAASGIALFVPMLVLVPAMVYFFNDARGFSDIFTQILAIYLIEGFFDRIFIDWYWVGKTKAWIIPGTEDLRPYVPKKALVRKWIGTLVGYPLFAAILTAVLCFMP